MELLFSAAASRPESPLSQKARVAVITVALVAAGGNHRLRRVLHSPLDGVGW